MILHVLSSDNDSGSQAEAESQRAGVHGGRRQDVAQGGKHPEAATGEKHIIEVRLIYNIDISKIFLILLKLHQ